MPEFMLVWKSPVKVSDDRRFFKWQRWHNDVCTAVIEAANPELAGQKLAEAYLAKGGLKAAETLKSVIVPIDSVEYRFITQSGQCPHKEKKIVGRCRHQETGANFHIVSGLENSDNPEYWLEPPVASPHRIYLDSSGVLVACVEKTTTEEDDLIISEIEAVISRDKIITSIFIWTLVSAAIVSLTLGVAGAYYSLIFIAVPVANGIAILIGGFIAFLSLSAIASFAFFNSLK